MGKASGSSPFVRPPSERSLDSGFDWCKPFMCQGTVEIGGVAYPVTVFRETDAQQSVCRNVTEESVSTGRYVLCRGMNSIEYYDHVYVELACPIVTAAAQVALADTLPVDGVDFLLGNDLAGARVFPSPVSVVEAPAGGMVASSYPVCAATRSMANSARAVDVSQDSEADSGAHGLPHDEPVEMGATVVGGGSEIGSLKAKESLLAVGTRGDAFVSLPQYQVAPPGCGATCCCV